MQITYGTYGASILGCIITGSLYVGLSVGLHEHPCEDDMRIAGIIIGSFNLIVAGFLTLLLCFKSSDKIMATLGCLIALFALAVIGIYIWSWVLILNESGVACRYLLESRVWLALAILHIIFGAFVGSQSNSHAREQNGE